MGNSGGPAVNGSLERFEDEEEQHAGRNCVEKEQPNILFVDPDQERDVDQRYDG